MLKINQFIAKALLCACEIAVGVLLLINPEKFTTNIIKIGGVLLLVVGLFYLVGYIRMTPLEGRRTQGLAKCLCAVFVGTFCLTRSEWFIATFPLLTIMYGVIILFTGTMRIQWAVDMLRMKHERWYLAGISAVLSLIFAGIILLNPFETTAVLWRFVAIALIAEAVVDMLTVIFANIEKKSAEKSVTDKPDAV